MPPIFELDIEQFVIEEKEKKGSGAFFQGDSKIKPAITNLRLNSQLYRRAISPCGRNEGLAHESYLEQRPR